MTVCQNTSDMCWSARGLKFSEPCWHNASMVTSTSVMILSKASTSWDSYLTLVFFRSGARILLLQKIKSVKSASRHGKLFGIHQGPWLTKKLLKEFIKQLWTKLRKDGWLAPLASKTFPMEHLWQDALVSFRHHRRQMVARQRRLGLLMTLLRA